MSLEQSLSGDGGGGGGGGGGTLGGVEVTRKISRKSHRKSRNGCQNCKRRKIKCDEQKPQCSNCMRHSSHCSFAPFPGSNSSPVPGTLPHSHSGSPSMTPAGDTPIPEDLSEAPLQIARRILHNHPPLNIADLELLHHYNISTSYTLASDSALQMFFRINIPQIGFSYPFVLHGVLAISALHLSHFKRGDSHAHYVSEAHYHYETGLQTATSLLPDINEETCPSLYLFVTFCFLLTLGNGPKPGDLLLFNNEGVPEWLAHFRGMRSVLDSSWEQLRNSDLSPMFTSPVRHNLQPPSNDEHLLSLRHSILTHASNDPSLPLYIAALEDLSKSFPHAGQQSHLTSQAVFIWLFRLSDEFIYCLQQRNQIALVVLAHFCVLLNELSAFWWSRGWVEHLLKEIYGELDEDFKLWIRWPMEKVGWVPT